MRRDSKCKAYDEVIHELFMKGLTFPAMEEALGIEGISTLTLQYYVSSSRKLDPERWPKRNKKTSTNGAENSKSAQRRKMPMPKQPRVLTIYDMSKEQLIAELEKCRDGYKIAVRNYEFSSAEMLKERIQDIKALVS